MKDIEQFQDHIIALEQVQSALGLPITEARSHPDFLEVIGDMEKMVIECPSITDFYTRALKRYRPGKPERVAEELSVIEERVELMADVMNGNKSQPDQLRPARLAKLRQQIETGEIVEIEAKDFFKVFKSPHGDTRKPTRPKRKPARSKAAQPKQPEQLSADELTVTIATDSIRVNSQELGDLTPAQRVIILSGLAKGAPFKGPEIYTSLEFRRIHGLELDQTTQRDIFAAERKALLEQLTKYGVGELLHRSGKGAGRTYQVVAGTVIDERPGQPNPRREQTAPTPATRFYDIHKPAPRPTTEATQPDFIDKVPAERVKAVADHIVRVLAEADSIARSALVDDLVEKHGYTIESARAAVSAALHAERTGNRSRFTQVRDGGRRLRRTTDAPVNPYTVSEESPFNGYFSGDEDAFEARYGAVKGLTPTQVVYEKGSVVFDGTEQAVMAFFGRTGRAVVAQKQLFAELQKKSGLSVSREQLETTVTLINRLAGKDVLRLLPPASRAGAVKGPRIEFIAAFMEAQQTTN